MLTADPGGIRDINSTCADLEPSSIEASLVLCLCYTTTSPLLVIATRPLFEHDTFTIQNPLASSLEPPVLPVPACVADPLAFPVALPSPLEPLFLGMGDNTVIPSSPVSPPLAHEETQLVGEDYSPASPLPDLYELDAWRPPWDLTTPECQAAWEAELARSPTPPPTANEVIDMVLDAPRLGTPVYRLEVQPLMPPPRWVGRRTPPPPPPDHHLLTNGEIASWAERFVVADLMAACLGQAGSAAAALLWGSRHCKHNIPAHPEMEYPSDGTLSLQPRGSHQVERAHLMVAGGDGPGLVRSDERVGDPVMAPGWITAMRVMWHLPNPDLDFVARHNLLYSKRQPHESVTMPGGPPDPLSDWVAPMDEERVICSALAPPPAPSSYVDI
ncbi:uncharacterized protein UHOD_11085 [Ustilago sp. UG-2017b]|nr:uncharacterized protein UHOD_11085 [Ustilago sp. UG-2017b]